jgi:predicted NBD/HSP70 family sugar kinase
VPTTVHDLRRRNRAAVLRPLLLDGPQNRVGLSRLTGLSAASVTNVVGELLDERLVLEVGTEESNGGRPRVRLRVNPEFAVAVGIDVGETGVRVGGFDLAMNELAGSTVDVHPQEESVNVVVERVAAAVDELRAQLGRERRMIVGVGVAVPGVVEHGRAVRVHAPSIGWNAVPLAELFRERIDLPVYVENGAKTLGQAEMWFGAGRGRRDTVVTLWGTGVGAAIFVDGSLYRGAASSAGEWGHTNVVVGGERCRCGAAGCLEAYVGAEALVRTWGRRVPDQEAGIDRLVAAAARGGPAARVLDRAATLFGTAAANLVNLIDPELIVIGGWVGLKLGPLLLPKIREVVAEQALDYPATRAAIEVGRLGRDAVALGASTLVLEELLAAGGRPATAR